MSNLTRWEPVREMMTLREAMDRLFDDAFTRPISLSAGSVVPAIDLYQNDDEVVVKAALPGLKADDVQISITADVLTLPRRIQARGRAEGEDLSHPRAALWFIRTSDHAPHRRPVRQGKGGFRERHPHRHPAKGGDCQTSYHQHKSQITPLG